MLNNLKDLESTEPVFSGEYITLFIVRIYWQR